MYSPVVLYWQALICEPVASETTLSSCIGRDCGIEAGGRAICAFSFCCCCCCCGCLGSVLRDVETKGESDAFMATEGCSLLLLPLPAGIPCPGAGWYFLVIAVLLLCAANVAAIDIVGGAGILIVLWCCKQ